jgi:hypothetical protein
MEQEAEEHHGDPHPKRKLRINAYNSLCEEGKLAAKIWTKKVKYTMKTREVAKPGKYPRMIGDLSCPASLQPFRYAEFLKSAMAAEVFQYGGLEMEFVKKPTHSVLKSCFDKLLNPPRQMYVCYFSDDACFSFRHGDKIFRANIDISSCDASHTDVIFEVFRDIHPSFLHDEMQRIIDQSLLPFEVRSITNPSESVLLKPHGRRLYSGQGITTAINNLAMISIGLSIYQGLSAGHVPTCSGIAAHAMHSGYVISVEKCEIFEDVQFLKHSPVFACGEYEPVLNLGVLLRLSGVCKDDLPGSGDIYQRAKEFQEALLRGAYPRTSFQLLDNMKDEVKIRSEITKTVDRMFEYKVDVDIMQTISYSDLHLYRRYRLNPTEIAELNTDFGLASTGDIYASSATSKILGKDYGLSSCSGVRSDELPRRPVGE